MPTPTGLPKPGEHWRLTATLPPDWKPESVDVTIVERGKGDYWSIVVDRHDNGKRERWVDAAAWLSGVTGSHRLTYVGGE